MRVRAKSPPPSIKKRDDLSKPDKLNIPVATPSSPVVANLIQQDDSSTRSRSQGQKDLKMIFEQFVPPNRTNNNNNKNNSEPPSKAPSTNSTVSSSSSSIVSMNSITPSSSLASAVSSPNNSIGSPNTSLQKKPSSPLLSTFYQPDPPKPSTSTSTTPVTPVVSPPILSASASSSSLPIPPLSANPALSISSTSLVPPPLPSVPPPDTPTPMMPSIVNSVKMSAEQPVGDSPKPISSMRAAMIKAREKKGTLQKTEQLIQQETISRDPQRKYRTAPVKHLKKEEADQVEPDPVLTPKLKSSHPHTPIAETQGSTSTDSVLSVFQKV